MDLQLGICHRPGSYSDRWIEYCDAKGWRYKLVRCYAPDIIHQLRDVDALLWHPTHAHAQDVLASRDLLQAIEAMGLPVYPNTPTYWHFDNKVAQKYLLEALGAPLVPTYVFYSLQDALAWIDTTTFPKVFKLSRGAGSANVRLARDASAARSLARQAFGRGFRPVASYWTDAATKLRRHRRAGDYLAVLKRLPRGVSGIVQANRTLGRERGYVYFQDFLPDNSYDIRITIIGRRAFGFTRNVRKNDFRASGSGDIVYDLARIDPECVRTAFHVAERLGSQSMAFDFLRGSSGRPWLTEISYAFQDKAVYDCPGYWDRDLQWRDGHVWPQDAILEDLVAQIRTGNAPVGA